MIRNSTSEAYWIDKKTRDATTPLPVKLDLRRRQDDEATVDEKFREVVGSMAYLMTGPRPDL